MVCAGTGVGAGVGVGLTCAGGVVTLRVARPRSCAESVPVPARASDASSKSVCLKILFIFWLPAEKNDTPRRTLLTTSGRARLPWRRRQSGGGRETGEATESPSFGRFFQYDKLLMTAHGVAVVCALGFQAAFKRRKRRKKSRGGLTLRRLTDFAARVHRRTKVLDKNSGHSRRA